MRAGFRGKALETAFGISKRESGGRPDAFNPDRSTGDQSYGLFQINMLGNLGPSRRKQFGLQRNEDLLDPVVNAKAAFRMSNGGRDFGAWGIGPNAYRSGAGYDTIAKYVAAMPTGSTRGAKTPEYDVRQDLPASKAPSFKLPDFDVTSFMADEPFDGYDWNDFELGDSKEPRKANLDSEWGVVPPPPVGKQKLVAEVKARVRGGTTQPVANEPGPTPRVNRAMDIAKAQLGKPYVWGAASPGVGFDCSGLIEYAFEKAGIKTPGRLTTGTMLKLGRTVPSLTMAQPGDWLITNGGKHVVMYMGNGQVIAAPHTGEVVQYQPISRFAGDIVSIRRYP